MVVVVRLLIGAVGIGGSVGSGVAGVGVGVGSATECVGGVLYRRSCGEGLLKGLGSGGTRLSCY